MKNILKLNTKKRRAVLLNIFNICLENKKPIKLSIREHDLGVGTSLCSKLVNEGGRRGKISQNPVNVFCEWPFIYFAENKGGGGQTNVNNIA